MRGPALAAALSYLLSTESLYFPLKQEWGFDFCTVSPTGKYGSANVIRSADFLLQRLDPSRVKQSARWKNSVMENDMVWIGSLVLTYGSQVATARLSRQFLIDLDGHLCGAWTGNTLSYGKYSLRGVSGRKLCQPRTMDFSSGGRLRPVLGVRMQRHPHLPRSSMSTYNVAYSFLYVHPGLHVPFSLFCGTLLIRCARCATPHSNSNPGGSTVWRVKRRSLACSRKALNGGTSRRFVLFEYGAELHASALIDLRTVHQLALGGPRVSGRSLAAKGPLSPAMSESLMRRDN